jgi:hypothetical protein
MRKEISGIYVLGELAIRFRTVAREQAREYRTLMLQQQMKTTEDMYQDEITVPIVYWPPGPERRSLPFVDLPFDRFGLKSLTDEMKKRWDVDPALKACEWVVLGFLGKAIATEALDPSTNYDL